MLLDVKVLVWDFDGTLTRRTDEMFHAIRDAEFQVIEKHTGWTHEKAIEEFMKLHKVVTPSGTQVAARLANISIKDAAIEAEQYFDRTTYIKRDEKLIELFKKLKTYRHILLVNGVKENIRNAIVALGLKLNIFETIITPEDTGVTKPDKKMFQTVLDFTKRPGGEHLMIGDRPDVDLAPAKAIGMKTCLIGTEKTQLFVDIACTSVYDIASLN